MELSQAQQNRILELNTEIETVGGELFMGPLGQLLGADAPKMGQLLEAMAERRALLKLQELDINIAVDASASVSGVVLG